MNSAPVRFPPKLLIISYLFPPAGGIAVQRALSFTKYLSRMGFDVHVLSAGTAGAPVLDPGLLRHISPEVTLHRAFAPTVPFALREKIWKMLSRHGKAGEGRVTSKSGARPSSGVMDLVKQVICPDPEIVWVPFAFRKASKIVKQYGIEVVFVTAPPFSAFLTGNALKRRFPNLRLVSDFRDDWVGFYLQEFSALNNETTVRRSKRMERTTVEASDLVIVVTQAMLALYRKRYSDLPASKFAVIANGYDPESFADPGSHHGGSKIVFTFAGTVYRASSPRTYLEAIEKLPDTIREQVETRFFGRVAESERQLLESTREQVELAGFLPQEEALARLRESDYLLLIMTDPTASTGKLFEYIATGRPILALAPTHGEIASILRQTETGWCVDPNDTVAIAVTIEMLVGRARSEETFSPNWEQVHKYARPRLAEQLAERIRQL